MNRHLPLLLRSASLHLCREAAAGVSDGGVGFFSAYFIALTVWELQADGSFTVTLNTAGKRFGRDTEKEGSPAPSLSQGPSSSPWWRRWLAARCGGHTSAWR
uniref:Legume lectin domain-containing protein n=1 Tax=Oryza punctata TaxID=4537 RepID=A0A0E0LR69_ORYPU